MFRTVRRTLFCALMLIGTMGATPNSLGSADGEKPGSRIDITELKRVSGNMVSLKFVFVNNTSAPISLGGDFEAPNLSPSQMGTDAGTISGVYLEDASGGVKYVVARDVHGDCTCSSGLKWVAVKSQVNLWAKFPAPPESVTKLNVVLPHFQPVEDVPLKPLAK